MNTSQSTGANSILKGSTKRRKPRAKNQPELPLEQKPHLQIVSCPISERVDPRENTFILIIAPLGIRAAGGQYTADEAHEIAKITRRWDWSLDENQRPKCLPRLEELLDKICKRSAEISDLTKGGEG